MSWLMGILAGLLVLEALRLRGRIAHLPRIPIADTAPETDHSLLIAPGVTVPAPTERAARAYAASEGIAVLDLVPEDLPAISAMSLAMAVDASSYRRDRLAPGITAGHATLASEDVLSRSRATALSEDAFGFVRAVRKLKAYASVDSALAVAPGLQARGDDPTLRRALLQESGAGSLLLHALALPILFGLVAWGVVVAPVWGLIALVAWHLQLPITLAGGPLRPRDLALAIPLRAPLEIVAWARTLLAPRSESERARLVEARRPYYTAEIAKGPQTWFEPRRETCPVCEGTKLARQVETVDRYQHKPGRFRLDRCEGCGHVFQNPRLSVAGLNFYYADFYDGLGELSMERVFGYDDAQYLDRAHALEGLVAARRWLDVGTGHGHFCNVAADIWPETRFDGLDLSESVEEAQRRGWVNEAYRGLFPDLAPDLRGAYDVVSMHHYLEHTPDQRRELAAARTTLRRDGVLMIEVPDPTSRLGRLLRSFWVPWFQPQHLNLIPVDTLETLLTEAGFETAQIERGAAHQPVDLVFAVVMLLDLLGPSPDLPWRPPPTLLGWLRRGLVWTLGTPLLLAAHGLDLVLAPLLRRPGWSNTYRIAARAVDGPGDDAAGTTKTDDGAEAS